MSNCIVITQPHKINTESTISMNDFFQKQQKKKVSRRKRVSRRMAKKYPLFAIEFMRDEFNDIDYETWEHDVVTKKPGRSKRKGKSQLAKQGRFPMYKKALGKYHFSKKLEDLQEAQDIRSRMFKDFQFEFVLRGERKWYRLPSTASIRLVKKLAAIKDYESWEELDQMWLDVTKYEQY